MPQSPFYRVAKEAPAPWEQEESAVILDLDQVRWAEQVRILKGQKFKIQGTNRRYLEPIYRDLTPIKLILKGRQTELSEWLVNMALYNGWRFPGTIGTYLAPRQGQVKRFREKRIDTWGVNPSPILKKIVDQKNSISSELKFYNGSSVYFVSSWAGFEEIRNIPNDFLYEDEIQSSDLSELDVAMESMSHSKFAWFYGVGTGGEWGSDWHKKWMEGKQYKWKKGAWVADNPTAPIASYWIPQHIVPWIGNEKAEGKRVGMTLRRWTTEVLGWWHKGRAKPITETAIRACFLPNIHMLTPDEVDHNLGPIMVGIDYGGGYNTVVCLWQILDERIPIMRLVYAQRIEEDQPSKQARALLNILKAYPWEQGVQDAGGGTEQTIQLEDAYGDKLAKIYYETQGLRMWNDDKLSSENTISVNRTYSIDRVIELINLPQIHGNTAIPRLQLPGADMESLEWTLDQFTCIEAMLQKRRSGQEVTVYVKGAESDRDDMLHSTANARNAFDIWKLSKGPSGAAIGTGRFGV